MLDLLAGCLKNHGKSKTSKSSWNYHFQKGKKYCPYPYRKNYQICHDQTHFFLFYSDSLTISFIRIHKKNRLKGSSLLHHEVDCFVGEPYM